MGDTWIMLITCYRCSGRPVCWGGVYRPAGGWCPQHTDTEPHIAPGTVSSPLGRLESPSKTRREKERDWSGILTTRLIHWINQLNLSVWAHLFSLKHSAVGGEWRAGFVIEFTVTFKEGGPKVPDEAQVHPIQTRCRALSLTSTHTHRYPAHTNSDFVILTCGRLF